MRKINIGVSPNPSSEENYLVGNLFAEYPTRPRERMYGSDAAFCPRKNFLAASEGWTGSPSKYDAASALYMGIGNGIEEAVSEGLERNNKLFFNNLYLPPCKGVPIGGKIDLVYLNQKGEIAIGELKSTGELPTEPKYGHVEQLMTYAAIGGYDIANLIYVGRNVRDRNGIKIKVFEMDTTKEGLMPYLINICLAQLSIDNNVLYPIPPHFLRSKQCNYCPFKSFCWKGEDAPNEFDYQTLNGDDLDDFEDEAKEWAEELWETRNERYVKSLRHLYRNTINHSEKHVLIKEIEKYDEF